MLANFILVAGQVATLFLLMGTGFLLTKMKLLTNTGRSQLTMILLNVAGPCLIVDAMQIDYDPTLIRSLALGLAVIFALFLVCWLGVLPCYRRQPEDTRIVLRFGSLYSNVGFMGFPLVDAILGAPGMVYAVIMQVGFNLMVWSHGVVLMGGKDSFSPRKLLLTPGIIGSVLSLLFYLLHIRFPGSIGSAVSFLGSLNTPLAMLVIGSQMAEARILDTFRNPRLYTATAYKLLAAPILYTIVLYPLPLPAMLKVAFILLSATPSAGFTAIFSQQHGRDSATASQLVTLCTLLSIITLPCFAAIGMSLFF